MAKGDAINQLTTGVTASGTLVYQPSTGVDVLMTHPMSNLTTGGRPSISCKLFDGSAAAVFYEPIVASETEGPFKVFLNNSIYLQITNTSTGTATLGFSGIQTK